MTKNIVKYKWSKTFDCNGTLEIKQIPKNVIKNDKLTIYEIVTIDIENYKH